MDNIDFDNFDFSNIDPERINLGTRQQDCLLITQTFERAAHSIPTEAAVFSTLSRQVQNNILISGSMKDNLNSYFATAESISSNGSSANSKQSSQSFFSNNNIPIEEKFAKKLMDLVKDCIPCEFRLSAFAEVKPDVDILTTYINYYENALNQLKSITDIFNNFDQYGDFCTFINFFNFMCLPDIQRILSLLMALFLLEVPTALAFFDLLKCLIAPLFLPVILGLQSMLDQYMRLVTNPLDCVVEAINYQIGKLSIDPEKINPPKYPEAQAPEPPKTSADAKRAKAGAAIKKYASVVNYPGDLIKKPLKKVNDALTIKTKITLTSPHAEAIKELSSGLKQLNSMLQDGLTKLKEKLKYYEDQAKALIGDISGGDMEYLKAKMRLLQIVRMISFVKAVIIAISKGKTECNQEKDELNSYFQELINPDSPYEAWIDDNGQLNITEKELELSESKNTIDFKTDDTLSITSDLRTKEISEDLNKTTYIVKPCKLETSTEDVNRVNDWISQLNKK